MRSAHGNVDGLPNSSWFHQFPQRPIACASGSAGAAAVNVKPTGRWCLRIHQIAVPMPNSKPPGIPSPPCQMAKIFHG